MKRRNFLKAAVAALLAPAALVKAEKPKHIGRIYDGPNRAAGIRPAPGEVPGLQNMFSKEQLEEIFNRTAKLPQPDTSKLNDLFVSPEAMEDIRNWGVDQMDEITRKEIFEAGGFQRIRGVSANRVIVDEISHLPDEQTRKEISEGFAAITIPFGRIPERHIVGEPVCPPEEFWGAILDNREVLKADFK